MASFFCDCRVNNTIIKTGGLLKKNKHQSSVTKKSITSKSYLNHYFDHIYVINLKSQTADRLIVVEHLSKHGVDFKIFKAANGYAGEPLERYKEYQKRELGDLRRYPE